MKDDNLRLEINSAIFAIIDFDLLFLILFYHIMKSARNEPRKINAVNLFVVEADLWRFL